MKEPIIETPPRGESGLLVLLLEELVPKYLANRLLAAVLDTVAPIVSVQGGRSTATLRFGGGEVRLENGVSDDAWVHVHGDVDALLDVATGDDFLGPFLRGRVRVVPRVVGPSQLAGLARRVLTLPATAISRSSEVVR